MEVTGRKLVLFCEPCEIENSKISANGACRECKEYMCTMCFQHHLKSKQCRHHVLLSLEEFSSLTLDCGSEDVIKCNKHDDEIIKFYCRSHDIVGCGDCIVLEHTPCKPEYIKDVAKTFKDGDVYKSIVKRVEDLTKKKSDYEQEIEKGKEEIGKMNEKALKEIREFRKEINTCLDEAEANILLEMKKMTLENTGQLEKIKKGLQSLTSELQTMAQMLNTQMHHRNALFINAVNCKSKLTDLETMYESTTKEKALKGFEFVQNNHMSELLKAAEPLGSMKTKHEFYSMMRGSMMDWRSPNCDGRRPYPAVMRGQSPPVMTGPSPPVMTEPSQAVRREPSPAVMRGPSSADITGPSPAGMRGSYPPGMRGPSQADMRGPSPAVMRGPYPPVMRGSSPADMRGQAPPGMRGPSPADMRGLSAADMRGPSPAVMRGPSPEVMRGSPHAMMRQPSQQVMRGPSPEGMRGQSPSVMRGSSPAVMRGPSPEVMRGSYPSGMRGPSPEVIRGPYPPVMSGPSQAVMRQPSLPVMNEQEFVVGMRVRRGPHWVHGQEDGGGHGTITGFDFSGLAFVQWDNGQTYNYRIGQDNSYELEIIW